MQCTADEIAEKRRLAMERLKKKKEAAQIQAPTPNSSTASASTVTSPGTSTKSTSIFYGSDSQQKANALNQHENKMKQPHYHGQTNRILSQPYPKRDANSTPSTTTTTTTTTMSNNSAQSFLKPFEKVVTCACSMISPTRFQVVTCGYSEKLIDIFKTIPTRSYSKSISHGIKHIFLILFWSFLNKIHFITDHEKRIWSFDLSAYEEVQKKVSALNPHVVIGPIPQFVLKLLRQGISIILN